MTKLGDTLDKIVNILEKTTKTNRFRIKNKS